MDKHNWPYIDKSARRKKRLVKTDFDKKLRYLSKRRQSISDELGNLPRVVLEQPYQKGWVRLFVLRPDVARSEKAGFYQALLDKINTSWWHYDRSFKRRKVRKGTYLYFDAKSQKLQELDAHEFHGKKLNLSDAEKRLFYLKEVWDVRYSRWKTVYVFAEPWRFVLAIQPHIIYTARQSDALLVQEKKRIDEYIDWNNLLPRIWKLMGGKNDYWHSDFYEQPRYHNPLKNQPRYPSADAYLDN